MNKFLNFNAKKINISKVSLYAHIKESYRALKSTLTAIVLSTGNVIFTPVIKSVFLRIS